RSSITRAVPEAGCAPAPNPRTGTNPSGGRVSSAMGQLTFPIVPAGLVVDVMINMPASALMPLWSSGGGPPPISGRALIDTGSNLSAVALPILQRLGNSRRGGASTQGIGGSVQVNLFKVGLHIADARNLLLP